MARTLNEFLVSTSSYSYQITDAAMAGLDVDDLSIAVILHCNLSDGSELDAIVYSDRDFTSWFAVKPTQYRLFFSPEYCKNVGNGNFIISIPFWRLQYEVEKEKIPEVYIISANYEVVVFGFSTIEQPGGEISLTSSFQCIVIDDGIINFNKNRFPLPLQSTEPKGAGGKIII